VETFNDPEISTRLTSLTKSMKLPKEEFKLRDAVDEISRDGSAVPDYFLIV